MKYEDIERVNATLKSMPIKGKNYIEVNQRIKAFRMLHPQGSITTEMLSNENGICIFKAYVLTEEGHVLGTGTAYEKESGSFINKTSYIENCETSAVGRAAGMCGFGIDTSVASYEEVGNAIENQNSKPKQKAKEEPTMSNNEMTYREKVIILAQERNIPFEEIKQDYNLSKKSTEKDFKLVLDSLEEGCKPCVKKEKHL